MSDEEKIRTAFAQYGGDEDLAFKEWKGHQGTAWANRNPVTLTATNESWSNRYGAPKTWAATEALRGVPRDGPWLEVGCAAGAFMELLAYVGFTRLYGMDASLEPLRKVKQGPRCQADALRLPFGDGALDGIATSGTLMHLGPHERLRSSAREMSRVAGRWMFFMELWADRPFFVSFGDLLPPAWLYPWEHLIHWLGPEWGVRYHRVYELRREFVASAVRAPMSVTLLERNAVKT